MGVVLVLLALAGLVWIYLDVTALERWIAGLGAYGPLLFVLAFIVVTPLLVPDTPFAALAGAVFGLVWGTVLTTVSAFLSAMLIYVVSRWLLRGWLQNILAHHPRLRAVEGVVALGQKRLLVLLRLIPISPALVNYLLAATRISFRRYMLSCVGLIPAYFATAYVGWLARIAGTGKHAMGTSDYVAAVGFVGTVVALVVAVRAARRAIREATSDYGRSPAPQQSSLPANQETR